jgi:hypothetical protein
MAGLEIGTAVCEEGHVELSLDGIATQFGGGFVAHEGLNTGRGDGMDIGRGGHILCTCLMPILI